jgi:mRNA interferase MazF
MQRGELWWADLPQPVGRHPVVLISRNKAIQIRQAVCIAQVTSTIRAIPVEVRVGKAEGLTHDSVINCDVISTIPKTLLTERIGSLPVRKRLELDKSLRFALAL